MEQNKTKQKTTTGANLVNLIKKEPFSSPLLSKQLSPKDLVRNNLLFHKVYLVASTPMSLLTLTYLSLRASRSYISCLWSLFVLMIQTSGVSKHIMTVLAL